MEKLLLAGLVVILGLTPTVALAQAQAEEKLLVGEVRSVDKSGTEITLTDGTRLLTPPGSMLRPGALEEGMLVIAMYREQENGDKVLTRLSRSPNQTGPASPSAPAPPGSAPTPPGSAPPPQRY